MTATATITINSNPRHEAGRRHHAQSRPNYAVRRALAALLVLAALACAVALVGTVGGAVGALVDLGGAPAVASEIDPNPIDAAMITATTYVAVEGDSLWSIARAHHGSVSLDRYVDALISLNGGTTMIQVGQAVRLP